MSKLHSVTCLQLVEIGYVLFYFDLGCHFGAWVNKACPNYIMSHVYSCLRLDMSHFIYDLLFYKASDLKYAHTMTLHYNASLKILLIIVMNFYIKIKCKCKMTLFTFDMRDILVQFSNQVFQVGQLLEKLGRNILTTSFEVTFNFSFQLSSWT